MKFTDHYNKVLGELLDEERPYHRKLKGNAEVTDHESCARSAVERIANEYPELDGYQREECCVDVAERKSKSRENTAKGTASAKESEEDSPRDMRLFISVGPGQYVYMTEASIEQVEEEISRRQGKLNADRTALEHLIWAADVARRLGAESESRMGDYVRFLTG